MNSKSSYESRKGKINFPAEEIYRFVTDIRNLKQFIHHEAIAGWQADKERCSFSIPGYGSVTIRLTGKVENKRVVFSGDALGKDDFSVELNISGEDKGPSEISVVIKEDFSSMVRMLVQKHIQQLPDILVAEMETFSGWHDLTV